MEHSECQDKHEGEHICLGMGTKIFDYTIWGSYSIIFVSSHSENSNWRKMYLTVEREEDFRGEDTCFDTSFNVWTLKNMGCPYNLKTTKIRVSDRSVMVKIHKCAWQSVSTGTGSQRSN